MAGIEAQVLNAFLERLTQDGQVPASLVLGVGELLSADKLPKPDQLVDLFDQVAQSETP